MATIDDRPIPPELAARRSIMSHLSLRHGILLIAGLTCLAYLPSLNGKFILDDDIYLTNCRYIEASDGLYWFWFTNQPLDYYPVSNTSLWIEWRLWGLNPTGYHVTNVLLHIATALLTWAILRKLLVPGAFFAALLFAVHPVNVEAAAWISQRKDLLAMVFFLLSILLFLRSEKKTEKNTTAKENPGRIQATAVDDTGGFGLWYWLSLAAFVLAMLSKGSPAMLPVLLLGWALWQRRRIMWFDLWQALPFFMVASVLAVLNVWTQNRLIDETIRSGFLERLAGAGAVVWFYLSKAMLPINLVLIYPLWRIQNSNILWWLPLAAALLVTAFMLRHIRARQSNWGRPLLFAWGFFCVVLSPMLGFTDVGFMRYSLVADHYQHIAIIAVVALVAAAWQTWHQQTSDAARWIPTAAAGTVIVSLTFLTWQQNRLYSDPITLYRATLAANPDSWLARNNLGSELNDVGQPQEAIVQCREALRLKPDAAEAFYNLATAQKQLGLLEDAADDYRQAIALKPNFPEALNNYGIVLGRLGRLPEAVDQFQQALTLDPNYADAHSSLGLALFKLDRPQEALEQFAAAVRLQPSYAGAHVGLADVLAHLGRLQEAVYHYQLALTLKPQFSDACFHLAKTYAQMQQTADAIATAQHAIELARIQQQTELQDKIQSWLKEYLAQQPKPHEAGH